MQIFGTGPDDERFAAWCEVWAASQRDRPPDELPRPASDLVAMGRRLVTPSGSMDGTHRAAVAGPNAHAVRALRSLRRRPAPTRRTTSMRPALDHQIEVPGQLASFRLSG